MGSCLACVGPRTDSLGGDGKDAVVLFVVVCVCVYDDMDDAAVAVADGVEVVAAAPRGVDTVEGGVGVTPEDPAVEVKLWQATNPNARDFRMETLGPKWTSTDLTPQADGTYLGQVTSPAKGWTASMVELTFDVGAPTALKLTTDVRVIPDTVPHPAPSATRPKGFLSK